jgi:hypothetical protein
MRKSSLTAALTSDTPALSNAAVIPAHGFTNQSAVVQLQATAALSGICVLVALYETMRLPKRQLSGVRAIFGEVIDTTDEELENCSGALEIVSTVFSSAGEMKLVSLIKWHKRMGHRGMRVVKDMAKGMVTGMAIHDLPNKMLALDDCMARIMSKSKRLPFNTGLTRAKRILELVHGDLAGPIPVESGGGVRDERRRFIVGGICATVQAKSDAVDAFETWLNQVENETGKRVKAVMFDQAKELTMGRMKELCDRRCIRIITSVPYSPALDGVTERMVGVTIRRTLPRQARRRPKGEWSK